MFYSPTIFHKYCKSFKDAIVTLFEVSFANVLIILRIYEVAAAWLLTARQYGEVVLADEAPITCPGTLARSFSRCKAGMARVFAVMA
jgi:hypothetical protein